MIASATFYLAFTRKIYVARATLCHICPKITVPISLLDHQGSLRAGGESQTESADRPILTLLV